MKHSGVALGAVAAAICGTALFLASPAAAKAVSRDDFSFPKDNTLNVVVFRPDVHVGSLGAGGVDQPNAEWTESARANIQASLEAAPELKDANINFLDEQEGEQAELLNEYRGMFEVVANTMFTHVAGGGQRLPTKETVIPGNKQKNIQPTKVTRIDWTLGDGAARLKQLTGADYALFLLTHDSYGDAGRKAAQALGVLGCLIGACIIVPAGVHAGYSGLVDLENGNVVWFNTDLAMGGDVRDTDGAQKRVSQLLAGFPARPVKIGGAD